MNDATNPGGRIALFDPAHLDGVRKAAYERLMTQWVPWAEKSGFQSTTDGGRLIGPFNPLLLSPAIGEAFLALQEVEKAKTSLDARVREVIILTVGAAWQSGYELYAHAAVARTVGMPEELIRGLVAGGIPDGLSEAETLAGRVTLALTTSHSIDAALYDEAEATFGAHGLADIVLLTGCYHVVAGMLNLFEVPVPDEASNGRTASRHQASLTTVALFPVRSFLENLAVRADNSVLLTSMNARSLFYVPPFADGSPVEPVLLHRFDQLTTGIVEIEPDLFLLSTSNLYTDHQSSLHRIDMRNYVPGSAVRPETMFHFPETTRGLNGSCLLAPGVMLIADCLASRILRVDFEPNGGGIRVREWLAHESMGYFPGKQKPEQPGVNGVRYAAGSHFLFYTATAKKLLMRVPVDSATLEPAGSPELVVAGRMGDDFCIDEKANLIYLATHRQNTIDRISMDPGDNSGFPNIVVGDPFTEALIGPCSLAWSRAPGEHGKVAYVISDGGTASPSPGGPLPARLQRVVF